MKKTLIALAAVAATGAAFAQSTVTIDGQVQLGVVKTNDRQAALDATNGTSQIRFRGTEDLGGGLKANFTLAMRLSPESGKFDGTNGNRPAFQGESTVGLSGNFGSVKLGRGLHGLQVYVNATDPFAVAYLASTATTAAGYWTDNDNDEGGAGQGRTDAISYTSPNFNGFTVAVAYGPKGNVAVVPSAPTALKDLGAQRAYTSFWLAYNNGPLTLGAGTERSRNGDGKVNAIHGIYDFGVVRLGGSYGTTTVNQAACDGSCGATTPQLASVGDKMKNWNVMAIVPMDAFVFKLGYGVAKNDTDKVDVTKKLGLGVDYNLSKRTSLFVTAFRDSAKEAAGAKNGYEVGVKHTF